MEFRYKVLGETVRALRIEKGLSQEVLSGLAGIARTHLTMIENESIHPNLETVWRLAQALEMRPSEFFARVESQIEQESAMPFKEK